MKAQDILQTIDSLDNAAKNQEGIEKIVTMLELSEYLNEISFDECISMVEKAECEARKINHNLFISQTNLELGEYYIKHYDLDLAEPYLRIAIENSGDRYYLKYDAYRYLAYLNLSLGHVDSAYLYYEKTLEVAQSLEEKDLCADAIHNIALVNRSKGRLEEAKGGFEKAVGLYYEVDDSLSAARSLNNIAMINFACQQYDEALSIFENLIPFFEREGTLKDLSMAYSNLSLISSEYKGDIDTAIFFLDKAKHFAGLDNDSLTMVDILLNEGELNFTSGCYGKAIVNFEEAQQLASRIFYNEGLSASYCYLAKTHYRMGNYLDAIDNIRLCVALEERIGAFLYTPQLKSDLLMSYAHIGEYDNLETEIMRRENNYDDLLAEKQQMENRIVEADALGEANDSLEKENIRLRYAVIGLATLLVVLAIYTIISGRPKKEK